MKPRRFFYVIATFVVAWTVLGASFAKAQVPPKSGPLVPLTQVTETPVGSTGWCGNDFVIFGFTKGTDVISNSIVWFSNDADSSRTSRAIYYHWYDQWYNLIAATTTPVVAKSEAPLTFLEAPYPDAPYPAGFYGTYTYRGGSDFRLNGRRGMVVVTIFLRANAKTCVIHKVIGRR